MRNHNRRRVLLPLTLTAGVGLTTRRSRPDRSVPAGAPDVVGVPVSLAELMGGAQRTDRSDRRPGTPPRRSTLFVVVRMVGRALVAVGALAVLFAAFEVWGTGILEARAQHTLRRDFAVRSEAAAPTAVEPGRAVVPPAPPSAGEPVARIQIPSVGIDRVVVEGVAADQLREGPGRYQGTAWPGRVGNVGIAGHRTTYGAPFNRLDELTAGSEILLDTIEGSFVYRVTEIKIVSPNDVGVLAPTPTPTLTLTTCHPKLSARQRLVVTAALDGEPLPTTVTGATVGVSLVGGEMGRSGSGASSLADETSAQTGDGWPSVIGRLVIAGLPAAIVAAAWWFGVRRWRTWRLRLAGVIPFLVTLVPFFVALEGALPANF